MSGNPLRAKFIAENFLNADILFKQFGFTGENVIKSTANMIKK